MKIFNSASSLKNAPRQWFSVNNAAKEAEPVEILIFDQIGKDWWTGDGVAAKDFAETLKGIPSNREIVVGINSPGGNVWDGLAIYNMLQQRKDKVTTRIDGIAASIASIIALAGKDTQIPENALMMIHRAWGMAVGNAEDMTKLAAELEKHDGILANIYVEKTGKSLKEIQDAMSEETWFTGKEAKEFGLANTLTKAVSVNASFDFSNCKNLPAALRGAGVNNQTVNTPTAPAAPLGGTTPTQTMTEPTAQVPVAPVAIAPSEPSGDVKALQASLDRIQNQLKAERENRISRDLDQLVIENRLTVDAAKEWLPKCIADESILASLKKLPQVSPGAEPVNGVITGGKSVARQALEGKTGKDRVEFLKNNWNALQRGGIPLTPMAANTVDTALTTDMLKSSFIVVLQNRLPALNNFTRNFGVDMAKPESKLQVPIVTAGGTAQEGATDFEDATNFVTTVDNVEIDPIRVTAGAHLTPAQLNSGITMQLVSAAKANEFADKIQGIVNAIITTSNFTATPVVSASGAFGQSEMNALWAVIAKAGTKNIMLHQDYFKQLLPGTLENFNALANNIPGWDNVSLNTYWTGAEANTYGFACAQEAIGIAAGLPLASPNRGAAGTIASTLTVPGLELTVELQEWYSNKTKTDWANWEVYFAAAKGDGSAGVLLKSQ